MGRYDEARTVVNCRCVQAARDLSSCRLDQTFFGRRVINNSAVDHRYTHFYIVFSLRSKLIWLVCWRTVSFSLLCVISTPFTHVRSPRHSTQFNTIRYLLREHCCLCVVLHAMVMREYRSNRQGPKGWRAWKTACLARFYFHWNQLGGAAASFSSHKQKNVHNAKSLCSPYNTRSTNFQWPSYYEYSSDQGYNQYFKVVDYMIYGSNGIKCRV